MEVAIMAIFICEKCGEKVDTRCKPKKCPSCSESGTMCKEEAPATSPKKGKK
jgi:rubrerythrin